MGTWTFKVEVSLHLLGQAMGGFMVLTVDTELLARSGDEHLSPQSAAAELQKCVDLFCASAWAECGERVFLGELDPCPLDLGG